MPIDQLQTLMMKDEFCLQITHEKRELPQWRVILWECSFKSDHFICRRYIYKTITLRNGTVSDYRIRSTSDLKNYSIPKFESFYKMWVNKGCHLSWGDKIEDLPLDTILVHLPDLFP